MLPKPSPPLRRQRPRAPPHTRGYPPNEAPRRPRPLHPTRSTRALARPSLRPRSEPSSRGSALNRPRSRRPSRPLPPNPPEFSPHGTSLGRSPTRSTCSDRRRRSAVRSVDPFTSSSTPGSASSQPSRALSTRSSTPTSSCAKSSEPFAPLSPKPRSRCPLVPSWGPSTDSAPSMSEARGASAGPRRLLHRSSADPAQPEQESR